MIIFELLLNTFEAIVVSWGHWEVAKFAQVLNQIDISNFNKVKLVLSVKRSGFFLGGLISLRYKGEYQTSEGWIIKCHVIAK